MFFGVSKFESRLALFFIARIPVNHAGFGVMLYPEKVSDLIF